VSRNVGRFGSRTFNAGVVDNLTADFAAFIRSGNAELRPALRVMRARSRSLAENNDYMREFLRILRKKVLGADGIKCAVRAMRDDGKTLDQADSDYLKKQFDAWATSDQCTVCGRYTLAEVQHMALNTVPRDGEVLIRLVRGFPNKWGFALQFIEADQLDENLNVAFGAGYGGVTKRPDTEIRMSVERDRWGRAVAYHVLTRHPGDDLGTWQGLTRYERIDAADMIHLFVPDRVDDARGAPWAWTAIRRLQMTGGYEEAELVAARLGASKAGFITEEADGEVQGDSQDGDGDQVFDVQPGEWRRLPAGAKVETYDPQHPNSNFGAFMKTILRGASAGLGVGYNSLAKDGEGINFSTQRHFELDDREYWKLIQGWLISRLLKRVYSTWLDMSLLTGALNLPPSKRDKFDAAIWRPRGWGWVDPQKDITADAQAVNLGVKSLTQVCDERGVDIEDVFRERRRELDLAEQYDIPLGTGDPKLGPPAPADDPLAANESTSNQGA
jgi:lambda family phage portal protein